MDRELARCLQALRYAAEAAIGAGATETQCMLTVDAGMSTGLDRRDDLATNREAFAEAARHFGHAA